MPIENHGAALLDAVGRATAHCGGANCHWLIDPALVDPVHAELAGWAEAPRTEIRLSSPDVFPRQSPYLLSGPAPGSQREAFILAGAAHSLDECTVDIGASAVRPRSVCMLIMTDMPTGALALAIARSASVVTPDGQRRIFRFWDPRVLPVLVTHAEYRNLLPAGIDGMCWIVDAFGRLLQFDIAAWPREKKGSVLVPCLTETQTAWLEQLGEGNRVLEHLAWKQRREIGIEGMPRILDALATGLALGLKRADDRVAFAARRVTCQAPIELSDTIQHLIAAASDAGLPYAALQKEIPPEDWSRIEAEALRTEAVARQTIGAHAT